MVTLTTISLLPPVSPQRRCYVWHFQIFCVSPPAPPSLLSSGYCGALSLEVKLPGRETDHSPPSSAGVKNSWSYTSTRQYVFMAWCLVKNRDNFTFTFIVLNTLLVDPWLDPLIQSSDWRNTSRIPLVLFSTLTEILNLSVHFWKNYYVYSPVLGSYTYEGISKSFRTKSITKKQQQHKGLWQQNSLGWLTK
jgi:hypothetical protein